LLCCLAAAPLFAQSGASAPPAASSKNEKEYALPAGTVVRAALSGPVKVSHLKPGSELEGKLVYPVYVFDREAIPAGSAVRIVVDSVEKKKSSKKKDFMERLETVRSLGFDRKYVYDVKLRSSSLTMRDGSAVPIRAQLIQAGQVVQVRAKGSDIKVGGTSAAELAKAAPGAGKVAGAASGRKRLERYRHPVMTLKLEEQLALSLPALAEAPAPMALDAPAALPAGTHARLLLLTPLRAGENHAGDVFQARLEEPIFDHGRLVLPAGSLFEGHIKKVVRPRRLGRAASLLLTFDKFTLPDGSSQKIDASLDALEVEKTVPMSLNSEGGLSGKDRGAKRILRDFGISLGADQIADEITEQAIHALAPYAGAATGMFFFLGRRGNDVNLPEFSELEVVLNRPVTLPAAAAKTVAE